MACNCTTQSEIDNLYKMYGQKYSFPKGDDINGYLKYIFGNAALYILAIFIAPILLIYVLLVLFWKENPRINVQTINLKHIFNKKHE